MGGVVEVGGCYGWVGSGMGGRGRGGVGGLGWKYIYSLSCYLRYASHVSMAS